MNHARLLSGESAATHGTTDAVPPPAQQQFRVLAALNGPRFVAPEVLDGVDSALSALHLSIQIGHRQTQGRIADRLGIGRAHFSRMLNGSAAVAVDRAALASVTGNWALLQWEARQAGCDLVPHNETEIERLRREVAALKAQGGR